MRHASVWLGLALAAGLALPVLAQDAYPGAGALARAEQKARTESVSCERELKAGRSGPGCGRYHAAVLLALGLQNRRLAWCNGRMSEQSAAVAPTSCLGVPGDMRLDTVEGLERKASPATWKAFDKAMGKVSP
jgi:hypothetical protein